MKIIPQLISSAATFLAAITLTLGAASISVAAPITGDPQAATPGWAPNSTNALNYAQQTPGRVDQTGPYVLFKSNAVGSVTLDFFNMAAGLAFFETRIDGVATGATPHPVVLGSTIHTGGTSVGSGVSGLEKTFLANSYVDIRLALGGERDWDFNWTRFEVQQETSVPEPAMLGLLTLSLLGMAAMRRRRSN